MKKLGFALIVLALVAWSEKDQVKDLLNDHPVVLENQAQPLYAPDAYVAVPQDGDLWHTVLILSSNWRSQPEQVKLHNWFHGSNRALTNMVKPGVTKFHEHTNVSREYRNAWYSGYDAKTNTRGPAVLPPPSICLVDPTGERIYKAVGSNVPKTAKQLIFEINKGILENDSTISGQLFPNRPRILPLRPCPGPECPPEPKKVERKRLFPRNTVVPDNKDDSKDYSGYAVVIAILIGLYWYTNRGKEDV